MSTRYQDGLKEINVSFLGAGRGGNRLLPHAAEFSSQSESLRLHHKSVDPIPGKAFAQAERGKSLGLATSHFESTGEYYLAEHLEDETSPIVFQVDHGGSVEHFLRLPIKNPILGYIIIDLPRHGVTAWRFCLREEDVEEKQEIADFFGELVMVAAPGSTEDVFGAAGREVNRVLEDRFRAGFASHFKKNISKVIHGLEPESPPAEVTFDGRETSQVVILDKGPDWRDEEELLSDLEASLRVPIRPGTNFAVVELGQDSIRIHQARYRATDARFALLHPIQNRPVTSEPEQRKILRPQVELSKLCTGSGFLDKWAA